MPSSAIKARLDLTAFLGVFPMNGEMRSSVTSISSVLRAAALLITRRQTFSKDCVNNDKRKLITQLDRLKVEGRRQYSEVIS